MSILVAKEQKDPLAVKIFHNAGVQLGKHVRALIPKADKVSLSSVLTYLHIFIIEHADRVRWPQDCRSWICYDQSLGSIKRRYNNIIYSKVSWVPDLVQKMYYNSC